MAVASETVTSECGRIQTAYALVYAVRPAPRPSTVAPVASRLTTTSATWVTATKPSVQRASRKVWPSPEPRRSSRGRKRYPAARRNGTRTAACTAMPAVAPSPSTSSWVWVKGACTSVRPKTRWKTPRTPIETTLLAIGAHIIGPKRSRALSTWPARTCTP